HELAFRMSSGLTEHSMRGARSLPSSYQALRLLKGEAGALDWIRARLPAALRNQASMVFFDRGEDGLLWEAIEHPAPEWVWLVRALAEVRRGRGDRARRALVAEYFSTPRPDQTDVVGDFLLGKASEKGVWQRATDARTRADGAYAVGLGCRGGGGDGEASDW